MKIGRLREAARRFAWPLVAVAPVLVVVPGMLSTSRLFIFRDMQEFLAAHLWFRHTLARGELPLWDPYVAFGQSAVADPVRQILFPPAVALRALPSDVLGFNLFVGLALVTAALGVYLLARESVSKPAAALAAASFGICSPVLSSANMPNLSWSIALAPWVLLCVGRLAKNPSGVSFALAGVACGLQMLAGEPVTFAMTSATAVAYAAFGVPDATRSFVVRGVAAGAALASGACLAAIQYLPTAAAVAGSYRGVSKGNFAFWQLHPLRLLELVTPQPFGDAVAVPGDQSPWFMLLDSGREPFLISIYVGAGVLAIAALGGALGARRYVLFWSSVVVVGLVFALGQHGYLYPALGSVIAPLRAFRYPEKHVLVATLGIAMLSARGWEAMLRREVTRRSLVAPFVVLGAIVVALVIVRIVAPDIATGLGLQRSDGGELRGKVTWAAPTVLAVCVTTAAAMWLRATSHPRARLAFGLLCVVVLLDLGSAGFRLNPQIDAVWLDPPTWVESAVAAGRRTFVGGRLYDIAGRPIDDPDGFSPSIRMAVGTPQQESAVVYTTRVGVYGSRWGLHDTFAVDQNLLWPREYHLATSTFLGATLADRERFLHRVGVRTQLLRHAPDGPNYGDSYGPAEPIEMIEPIAAYTSTAPFDRALVVPKSRVEPDTDKAIEALFVKTPDFAGEVRLDRDAEPAGTPGEPGESSARIVEDRANSVVVEAVAPSDATLVLLDTYDAGWHVDVDGAPAPLLRADGLFRAVKISPGTHTIRMTYRPPGLAAGAAISLATALALLAAALVSARRNLSPRAADHAAIDHDERG